MKTTTSKIIFAAFFLYAMISGLALCAQVDSTTAYNLLETGLNIAVNTHEEPILPHTQNQQLLGAILAIGATLIHVIRVAWIKHKHTKDKK